MRIGIMLRSLDEKGGVGVYTENLLRELVETDRKNDYVLFYRTDAKIGRYGGYPNVTERLLRAPNKAIWDQVLIPLACWREKVDVVFNPKFTVPLLAPCKAAMVVHGADWFIPEQAKFYKPLDVRYIKAVMPWYFRRATVVLSVSQLTTDNFNRVLKIPPGKVVTVYFGPAKHFRRIEDSEALSRVKDRYGLPDGFIFTLSKTGGGDSRKNFGNLLEAYKRYHAGAASPHKLVVGGKGCERFRIDYEIPSDGYGRDIIFPGWIDQQDLPAVYSLADLYLYPSNLEAFPIPITEAMACGTPIVTSNVNGLEEIAGDAALLVDPQNPNDIAAAMSRVMSTPELRQALSQAGLERAKRFTWEKCGRKTLEILESLA